MKTGFKIFVITFLLLLTIKSYGQCGAVLISADDTIICVPQVVKFKALNLPAGTTCEWNVGGGYVSSDSTFTNLFNTATDYTISLRLTYVDNSKCTIIKTSFIKGKGKPVISISSSMNVICNFNDSVVLTDNTSKSYSRDWLLNNTLYKNGPKNLKVLFSYPSGYKNVTVFMKDSFGCTAKRTIDSVVYVADSVKIDFAADKLSGCIPQRINFTNLTDSVNNQIASWNWSFPKATPFASSLYQPKNIRYATVDTFDVSLKVTTKRGCVYALKKKSYLQFGDSVVLAATFSKTALCGTEKLRVTLTNSRSPAPVMSINPATYDVLIDSATSKTFSFTNLGSYTFYMSDTKFGCKSEKTFTNKVNVNGPLANFNFPLKRGCLTPDTFIGTNTSIVNNGVTVTLKWNLYFDTVPNVSLQSGTSDPFRPIAKYNAKYTVKLVISGSNGCKDSLIRPSTFIVDNIKPNFSWSPIPACPGEFVKFTNATKAGSSKVPNVYKWTFYNLNNTVLFSDTAANTKLKYPAIGNYSVKLMAYNSLGCKDSVTFVKKVQIQVPAPIIQISDSNVCVNQPTIFKVKFLDTNYYTKYNHSWTVQHTDSAAYSKTFTGDSVSIQGLWPGIYTISYNAQSKTGTCSYTFKVRYRLFVSGDRYKASASSLKGCNPFTTTLTAKRLMTFNFKNGKPNTSVFYWLASTDTNELKIASLTSLITNARIKKPGTFYFGISYYNSSGCSDSFGMFAIASGVQASFSAPINACIGKPIKLVNNSDPDAIRFKWFVKDSTSPYTFYPSDTSKNPQLVFTKDAYYSVGLITFGNGSCSDTFYRSILVNDIKAQFSSNDTLNYCAPIIASVSALTHPYIYKYSWYFSLGDTITQNLSSVSTLFSENTGPLGSNVRLIVDAYGCSDTLEKKGFIKVIGPIPKFTLQNNLGCEKLVVKFNNKSRYYNRFYLEYGDGTFLDSVNFNTHTYQIFDRSLSQQVFKPKLFVIDSLGCLASYNAVKPTDSVVVLRAPNANYTIDVDTGCADLLVKFKNLSLGAISYKWDFGDGTFNFTPFPQKLYKAGDFKPLLIARGPNGCEDTIRNKYFIKSYSPPVASFVASTDTVCYNSSISFAGQSAPSNSAIKKWLWDFGNPNIYKDSSTRQNPTYKFTNPYLNQVVLFVTDNHNCTDTSDQFVFVNDTLGLVSPPMNFVTVQNNDVFVNWTKSSSDRFTRYDLYWDKSNKVFLDSFPNRNDTTSLVTPGNLTNRYCYTINTLDKCHVKGAYAPSHCTIVLTVDDSMNKLVLNWLSYDGWSKGVERYLIYRSENGSPFMLLDSTTNTSYNDKELCNKTYCYYIVAIQKNGRWRSRSNTICTAPLFISPTVPVIPIATTVLSDHSTYTRWLPYKFVKDVRKYHISRNYAGSGGVINYGLSDSTGFIDKGANVNTNENSYTYTVRAEDHCGNLSPESSISKTILLKGNSVNYVAKLDWTAYEKWFSGIRQYEVFLREADTFRFLTSLDKSKNAFDYNYVDTKLDDSICFKIRAIKDTAERVISNSNNVCLVADPQLWVPNAFTPNKDGNNEVFIPEAILIFNKTGNPILDYHIEIFNRWGEKVFESFDVHAGWDGNYNGKQCQEGNYMYKIKGLGLNGTKNFNLDGIITLLR